MLDFFKISAYPNKRYGTLRTYKQLRIFKNIFLTTLSHLSSDHEASFLVSDECVDGSDHPFQLLDGEGHFVVGLSAVLGSVHMDVHLRETSKTLKTVSEI